jgi:hypothetical protein
MGYRIHHNNTCTREMEYASLWSSTKSNQQFSRPTLPWLPLREGRTWEAVFNNSLTPTGVLDIASRTPFPAPQIDSARLPLSQHA